MSNARNLANLLGTNTKVKDVDVDGTELVLDADADTSITADTDDQIDFKIGGTDQITIKDGAVSPVTNNDIDLGTSSLGYKDIYLTSQLKFSNFEIGDQSIDGNTVIFRKADETETMRINSSGNVGIGTTSPPSFGSGFTSFQVNGSSSGIVQANNSTNSVTTEIEAEGTRGAVGTRTNHAFVIKTNQTEAMRINSSGAVMIGTTSSPNNAPLLINCATDKNIRINQETHASVQAVNDAANAIVNLKLDGNDLLLNTQASGNVGINRTPASTIKLDVETSGSNHPARFKSDNVSFGTIFDNIAGSGNRFFCDFRINNSTKGKIFSDGSTTTYSQSSDYRLKENVVTDWDATTRLKQLKPSRFNFKENKEITYDGFLAHEVSSIVPQAVDGEKDAVDENGNPQYQGIDHGKLVPLLTKALQEAIAKIETLEAKVTALESK